MTPHRLYVGTIGEGLFRSPDHGETFRRAADGLFVECDVRALLVDPDDANRLYLGNEQGVFVSGDGADNWRPLLDNGTQVWSLHRHGRRLLAGARPAAIWRSDDGGATWATAATRMEADCPRIVHTRVTTLAADPDNPDRLWAGVEIDGVHQSDDGGRSWAPVGEGHSSRDIHAIVALSGGRLLACTNRDLDVSDDGGRSWRPQAIHAVMPWPYCRALAALPGVLLLGNGEGPPGWAGAIGLSEDGGRTWRQAEMPGRANSTIWAFATHPADTRLVYAASVSGQLYRSLDGGRSWVRLAREFGEVRALAWAPA